MTLVSSSRLLPRFSLLAVTLSLGTLHCGDDALILGAPPEPTSLMGETPTEDGGDAPGTGDGAAGDGSAGEGPAGAGSAGGGGVGDPGRPGEGSAGGENPSSGGTTGGECQPRGVGGPFWLTEGESIEIAIECATGAALGDDLEIANLPPNASLDAAARIVRFTPELDQAGVYALDVGLSQTGEHGSIEVQVADRFDAAGNVPVDPVTYTEELGLPVLHLEVDPGINEDGYLPATITYRGHTFSGAEAKYRGQTSLRYPKKSFTLKFTKEDRFGDPERVPGFAEKRKITLTTTFDDNTNLRARLAFELWNRIEDGHVDVQSYNAVVYLNGEFWGLYTITDHVDGRLMEDYGLYQEGNLYKARTHDANFRLTRTEDPGGDKLSLSEGYTKEEGTPLPEEPGAFDDLEALVSWVATSSSESFLSELDTRLARREYEDWWMLVSLVYAGDSAGKNSYHYRDPRAGVDNRFRVVPWDFNDSFGQTYYNDHPGREAGDDPEELASYNLLFERLLSEPTTRESIVSRYRSLLENEWALDSVLASFDTWAAENEPVARRDESKWGELFVSDFADLRSTEPSTHSEEMAYMRQWIIDRWSVVAAYY
jgi:CotH protein